jgi:molecular chaperone DnaK (HSP70)
VVLGRDEFEAICAPIFQQMRGVMESFVTKIQKNNGVSLDDIFAVEVVGGSSRTPLIKHLIKETFGKDASTTLNCDEAVARGCALMAAMVSPTFRVREFKVSVPSKHKGHIPPPSNPSWPQWDGP